jgi:hypothetical protein
MFLPQCICVESQSQYTFEQNTQNTNCFFGKKTMVFGGFKGFMLLLLGTYTVLNSDTIYLSLITYFFALVSKKPQNHGVFFFRKKLEPFCF